MKLEIKIIRRYTLSPALSTLTDLVKGYDGIIIDNVQNIANLVGVNWKEDRIESHTV